LLRRSSSQGQKEKSDIGLFIIGLKGGFFNSDNSLILKILIQTKGKTSLQA
jgi:hypothetical protein